MDRMHYLDLTLPTIHENLALDEALLERAEAGDDGETLRFWAPSEHAVVVGRSSRVAEEVRSDRCEARGVPVARRISGGASIVTGPGCLMYAVVLNLERRAALRAVQECHRFVLAALARAIGPLRSGVSCRGTSDLAVDFKKFSGNSLRMRRRHVLYHGTLLCDFDLALLEELLGTPPRQPDYRAGRSHGAFVVNLKVPHALLKEAIAAAFDARSPLTDWPVQETAQLVATRYGLRSWNEG